MTTWNGTIVSSADDALEQAGSSVINGANLTSDATTDYIGLRFQNVTIPQGANVSTATITVEIANTTYDDPDVDIYGQAADNAAAFTTGASNVSGRTATSAVVQWTATGIGAGQKTTLNIASVIGEIVGRAGWASGNALAIIMKGRSLNQLRFDAYDSGSGLYATLDVTYTVGGSSEGIGARVMMPGVLVVAAGGAGGQSVSM